MEISSAMDSTAMPKELTRGYSNSFLDMLARQSVTDPPALTIEQLNAMD